MTQTLLNFLRKIYNKIEAAQVARATSMVFQSMYKHKIYRETYNSLSKLTDKELKDIGIARGDIHSISMEAFFDNRVKNGVMA